MKILNAFMKSQYKMFSFLKLHSKSYKFLHFYSQFSYETKLQKCTVVVPWLYYASFLHTIVLWDYHHLQNGHIPW